MESNPPPAVTPPAKKKLSALQEEFCRQYIKTLNATQAAKDAGYKERSARSIGSENLTKPDIKARIDELLKEATLSAPEAIKSISDIARADISPYFTIRKAVHRPKIAVSLADYIECRHDAMERAKYVHDRALKEGLLGKGKKLQRNLDAHENLVNGIRYELIQLDMRLAQEPDATVIIDGPEELVEIADLDIARLVKDKNAGRIKSFQHTEHGPKIELYAADAALTTVAKYHGMLKDKVEHTGKDGGAIQNNLTITVVTTDVPFANSEEEVDDVKG